jgi:hypothetical protein
MHGLAAANGRHDTKQAGEVALHLGEGFIDIAGAAEAQLSDEALAALE